MFRILISSLILFVTLPHRPTHPPTPQLSKLMDYKMQLAEMQEDRDTLKLRAREGSARILTLEGDLKKLEGLIGVDGKKGKK